ncbi:MAG: hypothetical protein NDJ24_08175 [Alphaproteobacteria bacterium]|nr:hypothetical protein [Alphaproteobacteria bacterium]
MPSLKRLGLMTVTLLPLALTACGGEGWQMQPTKRFPYGNERTAGSGVEYVRASMMPAKGPVLEPAKPAEEVAAPPPPPPPPAPAPEPEVEEPEEPMAPADKVFNNIQRK